MPDYKVWTFYKSTHHKENLGSVWCAWNRDVQDQMIVMRKATMNDGQRKMRCDRGKRKKEFIAQGLSHIGHL